MSWTSDKAISLHHRWVAGSYCVMTHTVTHFPHPLEVGGRGRGSRTSVAVVGGHPREEGVDVCVLRNHHLVVRGGEDGSVVVDVTQTHIDSGATSPAARVTRHRTQLVLRRRLTVQCTRR